MSQILCLCLCFHGEWLPQAPLLRKTTFIKISESMHNNEITVFVVKDYEKDKCNKLLSQAYILQHNTMQDSIPPKPQ